MCVTVRDPIYGTDLEKRRLGLLIKPSQQLEGPIQGARLSLVLTVAEH